MKQSLIFPTLFVVAVSVALPTSAKADEAEGAGKADETEGAAQADETEVKVD